ncbi:FtsW/RodA/SpoVE family cell cycle protein [Gracilibacillus alcaliphilus]|uniref:FtsW/RodA/SpoVE family cell cycle protein n=1 Tax=Gracilibacillus alcaliphilus TaxID=1401441 RepID=UPI00195784F2|nr:FtsW/RodA/SpoVE family cell cycle protein [Gracilibacillus alcaliphilus]MBM7675481.1 cell division protein FtsW (lipid II flippase) [Gracilibacillus alcaliphilus]
MLEQKYKSKIDYALILIVIILAVISVFILYTLNPYLNQSPLYHNMYLKQIVWYIIGSMLAAGMLLFDYERLRQISIVLYGLGVLSLVMLYFHFPPGIATNVNGAWGWFRFPVIGTLQPAEFIKVFLLIFLAHIMATHNEKYPEHTIKMDLWLLAKMVIIALIPMAFLAQQPDYGAVLVLAAITGCMILVSGIKWRIILVIVGTLGIGFMTAIYLYLNFTDAVNQLLINNGMEHIVSRFQGWLIPDEHAQGGAYQVVRAMLTIGSGQLVGKGIGGFEMTYRIPEYHTDIIFSAIAEQFGFFGSSLVILIYFLLIYRLIYIALRCKDPFATYMIVGIIGLFTYQVFQNIGMLIQLLPVTGLPLPFISYGGNSIMTYMLAIGIALSVYYRTKDYMFEDS